MPEWVNKFLPTIAAALAAAAILGGFRAHTRLTEMGPKLESVERQVRIQWKCVEDINALEVRVGVLEARVNP